MLQRCERLMTLNCHHLEFRWCQKMLAAILCKFQLFCTCKGKLSIIARDQFNRANVPSILTKQFSYRDKWEHHLAMLILNLCLLIGLVQDLFYWNRNRTCSILRGIHWACLYPIKTLGISWVQTLHGLIFKQKAVYPQCHSLSCKHVDVKIFIESNLLRFNPVWTGFCHSLSTFAELIDATSVRIMRQKFLTLRPSSSSSSSPSTPSPAKLSIVSKLRLKSHLCLKVKLQTFFRNFCRS